MFVERSDMKFKDFHDGTTRVQLGKLPGIMGCTMTFNKGAFTVPHAHDDHLQFIYFLKGKFEITCGAEKRICLPGDCMYADYNELHGSFALEDGSMLLDVHTPMREDIDKDFDYTLAEKEK
ncbi:MAG: cupin domain-containing protein [Oscillospiraceae bacterium]|nr:cupin domain-containing protein [Oscillospiraceae bacterium]